MKKRLITAIGIGLSMLLTLIIFNLLHNNSQSPTSNTQRTKNLPEVANATDTAWFNQPEVISVPKAASPVTLPLLPLSAGPPLSLTMDKDQRARQAPIASNQILVESHPPTNSAGNNAIVPADHGHQPTDEKTGFLTSAAQTQPEFLAYAVTNPRSAYEIQTGTLIPAILLSGINSDLPGPIIAQVRENVYDSTAGRYLLIPQGTKLQGIYDSAVAYGQQRVLIAWQRLIFPNGQSLQLGGMPGIDVAGYAGFKDQTNNHYQRLFASALLMSVISAGLQLSQPSTANNNNNQPSVNQILAQNTGIGLTQTTDQLLRKNLAISPTLEIRPGYLFNVSVIKDIIFPAAYAPPQSQWH